MHCWRFPCIGLQWRSYRVFGDGANNFYAPPQKKIPYPKNPTDKKVLNVTVTLSSPESPDKQLSR